MGARADLPPDDPERLRLELEECLAEQRRLKLALDVLSPIDIVTGLRNRNGILDAIQGGLNWLARRDDPFAVLAVEIPGLGGVEETERRQVQRHLGAIFAAILRRVDEPGRLDETTFVAVLRAFSAKGVPALMARVAATLHGEGAAAGAFDPRLRVAALLVRSRPQRRPQDLLDRMLSLLGEAGFEEPLVVEV